MKDIEVMQRELIVLLQHVKQVCESFSYEVMPTLILRHEEGVDRSMLLSQDDGAKISACVKELVESNSVVTDHVTVESLNP